MDFGIGILIVTILAVLVFVGLFSIEAYKENKTNKEIKLRQNDIKLQRFYNEMNNDRNDGWTKRHYKLLYEERLKEIKNK